METATHSFSNTVSNPSSVQSHSHNVFHHSPRLRRQHHPRIQSSLHTPTLNTSQQLDRSPWHTSSTRKYSSPKLRPLISKFEALDSNSLPFNTRDTQPPYLLSSGSRMGRRGQGADIQQTKTTREKLLTLFDRPGWGARTLRELRDGGSSREFENIPGGEEGGPSRMQGHEALEQSISPHRRNYNDEWIPNARPGPRLKSRIMNRVRFFDGGMDFPSTGHGGPWELNRAGEAIPSRSQARHQPRGSPTKPGLYSVFPSTYHTGILTPIKSYGYLRPKETTPLPWRPLDARRWETVAQLTNSPDAANARGQSHERDPHSLITPNAASAAKKVQITYQDPKRNVSEKVSLLSTTRTKEKDHEHSDYETQEEKDRRSVLAPCPQPSFSLAAAKEHSIGNDSLIETRMISETKGSKPLEVLKLLKESKVQDRINLFSSGGPHLNPFAGPMTRMRNQSTPTKLPSELVYETPTKASSKVSQRNCNTGLQVEKRATKATSVTAIEFASLDVLETVADKQLSQLQRRKPAAHASAPRKSSGVSDKIQHFEAFASVQAVGIRRVPVDKNRKLSSPQSKRIQTWPMPASNYVFSHKTEQTKVPEQLKEKKQASHVLEDIIDSAMTISTESKNEQIIKTYQDREKAKQKIHSCQERLNRLSPSRPRSARSISRAVEERDDISRVLEQMKPIFGVNARIEGRTQAAKNPNQRPKTAPSVKVEPNVDWQQLGNGIVKDIWIDGGEDDPLQEVLAVDTVVAQCELAEPRPMRLAETLSMIRLCRGRFGERSGTWRRKAGRSSEKGGLAA